MHDRWSLASVSAKDSIRLLQQPTLALVGHGAPVHVTLVPHAATVPTGRLSLKCHSAVLKDCRVDG